MKIFAQLKGTNFYYAKTRLWRCPQPVMALFLINKTDIYASN